MNTIEQLIEDIQEMLLFPKRDLEYAFGRTLKYIVSEPSRDNNVPSGQSFLYDDTQNLLEIIPFQFGERSIDPGSYYYDWVPYMEERGLYMDANGQFYHAAVSGKGSFRHFAGGSADDKVNLEVSYIKTDLELSELSQGDLETLNAELLKALGEAKVRAAGDDARYRREISRRRHLRNEVTCLTATTHDRI
jgi:hypothetical protein